MCCAIVRNGGLLGFQPIQAQEVLQVKGEKCPGQQQQDTGENETRRLHGGGTRE
jgi:hypothetical protein